MAAASRVVLLTRTGCHLCDQAESVVATLCDELDATWQAVDVDSEPELRAHFTDHVPVVMVDGEVFSYWFVDAEQLRHRISNAPPNDPGEP
ncbi:MAG: glutaredoxin family protein [Arachnia sp.]